MSTSSSPIQFRLFISPQETDQMQMKSCFSHILGDKLILHSWFFRLSFDSDAIKTKLFGLTNGTTKQGILSSAILLTIHWSTIQHQPRHSESQLTLLVWKSHFIPWNPSLETIYIWGRDGPQHWPMDKTLPLRNAVQSHPLPGPPRQVYHNAKVWGSPLHLT